MLGEHRHALDHYCLTHRGERGFAGGESRGESRGGGRPTFSPLLVGEGARGTRADVGDAKRVRPATRWHDLSA
jgi:hypothetical protein